MVWRSVETEQNAWYRNDKQKNKNYLDAQEKEKMSFIIWHTFALP